MSARPRKKTKSPSILVQGSFMDVAENELVFIFALDKGIVPLPRWDRPQPPTTVRKDRKASRKFRKLWRQWYQVRKSQGLRMSFSDIFSDAPVKGFVKVKAKRRAARKRLVRDYLVRKARRVLNNE